MPNKTNNFQKAIKAEAEFFNKVADLRSSDGKIPIEADRRMAKKYIPKRDERVPIVDPKMTKII